MMKDGDEIRIALLTGANKAWLTLQNSILSYREKFWSRESIVDIPVELVTFTEQKRLKGSRLIAALLALLILPVIGGAAIGLWNLISGPPPDTVVAGCIVAGVVAGFLTFLVLLVRFFMRQKTITMHVGDDDMTRTFWADKKRDAEVLEIITEVARRKPMVEEKMPYPMQFAVGDTIHQPWKRAISLTFLFMIPAFITEIPWLLLAGLIPIGMQLCSSLMGAREPREFRHAVRHYLNREWTKARDKLDDLIRSAPDFRPARLFMIELKMRLGDFDGAGASLAEIQSDLDAETVQSIQGDIILMQRIAKRKKGNIQNHAPVC